MEPGSVLFNIGFSVVAFLMAITVHEFMHGRIAFALGDTTARDHGRLSFNPIKHLDPLGTIMLVASSLAGAGIGWAKPVPVNPSRFKNPNRDMVLVSLAGPGANFALAFVLIKLWQLTGMQGQGLVIGFLEVAVYINVMLGVFNLLPIPPLDGSKIVPAFLPRSMQQTWFKFEQYGFVVLLALVLFLPGGLSMIIRGPIQWIIALMV